MNLEEFITVNLENPYEERKRERKEAKWLFAFEPDYMANPEGYFQKFETESLRNSAVSKIRQLVNTPGFTYDSMVEYHALTYFDLCISQLQNHQNPENLDTFIVSCTVLAWRRLKPLDKDFSMPLFLTTNNLENKIDAIQYMKGWILQVLKEKMEPITALSFIDFFLSLIHGNDRAKIQTANTNLICRYIAFMHQDAEFTQFKPSILAAVGIVAEKTGILGPVGNFCDPILKCKFVDSDDFDKCFNLLKSRVQPPPPQQE